MSLWSVVIPLVVEPSKKDAAAMAASIVNTGGEACGP